VADGVLPANPNRMSRLGEKIDGRTCRAIAVRINRLVQSFSANLKNGVALRAMQPFCMRSSRLALIGIKCRLFHFGVLVTARAQPKTCRSR
jgi:hypothetical protein